MTLPSKIILTTSRVRPAGVRLFPASFVRAIANPPPGHDWVSNPNNQPARDSQRITRMTQGMANMRMGERLALSSLKQRRSFSTSHSRFDAKDKEKIHTAESYFKDVDHAPPPSEKTYQVDSANPTVQRPNEAMSGEYSRAGAKTKEYATVEGGTYDIPPSTGPEKDQKSRYGNTPRYYDEHGSGSKVSKPGEGPEGASAGGRKPEGRS
ncbi:hypothetical protein V8D89_003841 [Ganoderma adspersum]